VLLRRDKGNGLHGDEAATSTGIRNATFTQNIDLNQDITDMMARPNPICHTSQPEAKEEVQNLMKKYNRSVKEIQQAFADARARLKKRANKNPDADSTTIPLPFVVLKIGQKFGQINMDLVLSGVYGKPHTNWQDFRDDVNMKEQMATRDRLASVEFPK